MDHRCSNCGKKGLRQHFIRGPMGDTCPKCRGMVVAVDPPIPHFSTPEAGPQRHFDLQNIVGIEPVADPQYTSASFLTLITPDDVGAEKRAISPYMEETNIKAGMMKQTLPSALSASWAEFYARWDKFYHSTVIIQTGDAYKTALQFRFDLSNWQKQIDKYGGEPLTPVPMPNEAAPGAATAPGSGILDKLGAVTSTWSKVAVVGVVVGGGLLAWLIYLQAKNSLKITESFMPEIRGALTHGMM